MTVIEAERNLGELAWTETNKRKVRHYSDLLKALEEMDEEILKTFFNNIQDGV